MIPSISSPWWPVTRGRGCPLFAGGDWINGRKCPSLYNSKCCSFSQLDDCQIIKLCDKSFWFFMFGNNQLLRLCISSNPHLISNSYKSLLPLCNYPFELDSSLVYIYSWKWIQNIAHIKINCLENIIQSIVPSVGTNLIIYSVRKGRNGAI